MKSITCGPPPSGRWLLFDLTTGGFALEWFRNQFCREMDEETFYGDYLNKILKDGMKASVRFLPHLAGDRTSFLQKKASFSGLTLSTTREDCLAPSWRRFSTAPRTCCARYRKK